MKYLDSKKILILGGLGYIGSYTVRQLVLKGYQIYIYDNMMYQPHFLDDTEFYFGDITDYVRLKEVIEEVTPDIVINFSAIVGDAACNINPVRTVDVNQDAVKYLSENFNGKIIHISTCSVYGINNNLIDEETDPNPISLYAETKLKSEEYINNRESNDLIFRLGTLYGVSGGRPRLDLVVNIFSMLSALGENLTVTNPEAMRPILDVKDVCGGIIHGIENELSGLYILSQQNMCIGDIATMVQAVTPSRVSVNFSEKKEDLRNYMVCTAKIRETGWNPHFSLESGIMDVYNIVREKRIKDPFSELYHNGKFVSILESNN
jgi:nucleoside-diphosphate-sugar epimerase